MASACAEGSYSGIAPSVLLVADNGNSGGISRYCVDLGEMLGATAAVVCLCPEDCLGERPCWLAEHCRQRAVRLISIPMPTKAWLQGFRGLTSLWREEGRPIVHVNGRRGNFVATMAKARFPQLSFLTTVHGLLGLHARRNALYRLVDLGASHAADATIAVCQDTRRRLVGAGVPQSKSIAISNGLAQQDLDTLGAIASERSTKSTRPAPVRVGFLGRISPEKGAADFVTMARTLARQGAEASFVVVGSGPSLDEFLHDSHDLVEAGTVTYEGEAMDPSKSLRDIDILVMPSRNEGLPYVLLEAMAAGCAVVAYGVGGIPEVVSDSSLGLLAQPNDLDGLTEAVSRLVAHPSLTARMGAAASQHVRSRFALRDRLPLVLEAYGMCDRERAREIAERVARPPGDGQCVS